MYNEINKLQVVNKNYKLKNIYDELVTYVNSNIHEGVDFKSTYDDGIPEVLNGDSEIIKKILFNLLRNSINCTNNGYISFTFNSIVKDEICKLVIVVEDSGFGIKDEDIDKLFNKTDHGFGLTSTKEVLELMGGTIAVQSKYNEGSRFTLSIEQKVSHEKIVTFDGNNKKVLIVDDDKVNLDIASRYLKEFNLDITTLCSGMECINNILDGNKYELIIIDDEMPGMNGIVTLQNLKKIIGFNTPVIIYTSNIDTPMLETYVNEGFTDYLAKPISKNILEELLVKYIGSSENIEDIKEEKIIEEKLTEKKLTGEELLRSSGVNLEASLELLGDMDMYNDTIKDFYNESETRLKDIAHYKEIGDMPNYAILVHAMKSDSKYLGFTKLAELSYNHEMASKGNDINYVNEHYDELMEEANKIIKLAKAYIEGE